MLEVLNSSKPRRLCAQAKKCWSEASERNRLCDSLSDHLDVGERGVPQTLLYVFVQPGFLWDYWIFKTNKKTVLAEYTTEYSLQA